MRFRIFAVVSIVCVIALTLSSIAGVSSVWLIAEGLVAVLSLAMCYRSVAKPLAAVENGMNLLRSQDFSSRLRMTGQADADRVIELFNRLMDAMKAERLRSEEQNLFLARLIEVSPTGIAICDFDGNIMEMNPALRKMWSPQLEGALQALGMGESVTLRLESAQIYRCSRLWFMDSGFRRPFLLVELLTDEIALAEKNIFRKIVRTIGHEVNNTLGSVSSVLQTLAGIHDDDTEVSATLSGCSESCRNLVDFVRGYADVVKLPAPVLESVDLMAEIRRMLPSLQTVAGENVTVEVTGNADHATVFADMILIERVVVNIVRNAAESIGDIPDGRIEINVSGNTLAVTDNGRGISPEDADKIFTPFFSTKHADRGLGLMLVADILRAHNAVFSLRTDPDTVLTTFAVTFPR